MSKSLKAAKTRILAKRIGERMRKKFAPAATTKKAVVLGPGMVRVDGYLFRADADQEPGTVVYVQNAGRTANAYYTVTGTPAYPGGEESPGGTGDMEVHDLDGVYHSGTLPWSTGIDFTVSDLADLATKDHGDLDGLSDDDHTQYVHLTAARSISAQHTFAPGSAAAPFALSANAQGQTVTGLKADQLNRTITNGYGMTGGGPLTGDLTLAVDSSLISAITNAAAVETAARIAADAALSQEISDAVLASGDPTTEITNARGGETVLDDRLDLVDGLTGENILRSDYGGVGNGSTDDWQAYQDARTAAGANGTVYFPRNKDYLIDVDRPDLSGTHIATGPGVTLTMTEQNPNTQEMDLLTPLSIVSDQHATTRRHPANVDVPWLLHNIGAAAAAAISSGENVVEALAFDTDFADINITDANVVTASSATVTATSVTWASAFTAGTWEGVRATSQAGNYYEMTFDLSGEAAAGHVLGFVQTSGARVDFKLTAGAAIFEEVVYPGATVNATITTPNGGAYSLSDDGGVTIGLHIVSRFQVDVYINHHKIHTKTFTGNILYVGWLTSPGNSEALTFRYPLKYTSFSPQDSKPLAICCEGDSITYGAWCSITYPQMLEAILPNLPGIGKVTVTNEGISGQGSEALLTRVEGEDYSGYDYVLVMIGTNDCQGSVDLGTLAGNIEDIGAEIVADGAIPIFGVPPMFTTASVSGVTGVTTTNYSWMAKYAACVRRVCVVLGYAFADAQETFGTNLEWYGDNIHPTEAGQVAIAKAFAQALWQAEKPARPTTTQYEWTAVSGTLGGSWVAFGGDTTVLSYMRTEDNFVHIKGTVKSGTVGSGTTVFTLPTGYRPAEEMRFGTITMDSTTPTLGSWRIKKTGVVELLAGGNTLFSLDGTCFYADGT